MSEAAFYWPSPISRRLRSTGSDAIVDLVRAGVVQRVVDAVNDPTFLLAPAAIVTSFTLYNVNRTKLEGLLHRFFDPVGADVAITDRFGRDVRPREWFFCDARSGNRSCPAHSGRHDRAMFPQPRRPDRRHGHGWLRAIRYHPPLIGTDGSLVQPNFNATPRWTSSSFQLKASTTPQPCYGNFQQPPRRSEEPAGRCGLS